jgi:hypothetical protein
MDKVRWERMEGRDSKGKVEEENDDENMNYGDYGYQKHAEKRLERI